MAAPPGTDATSIESARLAGAASFSIRHAGRDYGALAWGPEDAPRVLALHGWLDNAASFARLAPLLSEFRIVATDLPGHGLSAHRHDGAYHISDYVFDVLRMADGLGWEQFDLLGHSLGACIAPLVAAAFPERIRSLALIEGLGPLSAEPDTMPSALARAWSKQTSLGQRPAPDYASFDEAVQARMRGGNGLPREAAEMLCRRGLKQSGGRWFWRNDGHLTIPSSRPMTEPEVLAFLARVSAPVLLVRAENGLPFSEKLMQARLEALSEVTLVRVAGGHHVHLEDGVVAVAQSLRAHLQSINEH